MHPLFPCPSQAHRQLVDTLSALQLESVVYACQRHQQRLTDGSCAGFFIGGAAARGRMLHIPILAALSLSLFG